MRTIPGKVFAVASGLLLLFWVVVVTAIVDDRRTDLAHAGREGVRSAQMLDAFASVWVDRADSALSISKTGIDAILNEPSLRHERDYGVLARRLSPWMMDSLSRSPAISLIAVFDINRSPVAAVSAVGAIDVASLNVDARLRDWLGIVSGLEPMIGPAVDLLQNGKPVLPIMRDLQFDDGNFAGTVVVGVPIDTLNRVYATAGTQCHGAIELRGRGDAVLYRFVPQRSAQAGLVPVQDGDSGRMEFGAENPDPAFRHLVVVAKSDVLKPLGVPLAVAGIVSLAIILMAVYICRYLQNRDAEVRRRRRAERKLLDAIDATSDIFVEFDTAMRIVEVSHRVERVTGLMPSHLIGLGIDQLRGEPADTEGSRAFRRAVALRLPFRDVIAPIALPGGRGFWIRGSGKPVFDERGAFSGYRCMVSDVTEQEMRKAAQIRQDRLMSLGQLAGGIAHDFNNLLSAILGFAALLDDDLRDDPAKRRLISRVIASTNRAKDLVKHILSFARLGGTTTEDVDVGAAVDEVLPLLRSSLPSSTEIEVDNRLGGEHVRIDRAQLVQVMVNLCTNANDAIGDRDGGIVIVLSPADPKDPTCRLLATPNASEPDRFAVLVNHLGADVALVGRLDPAVRYVRLSIADNGAGIPRADLSRIFEPYYTTKPAGTGGGLGLSVVHGIVLAANGALAITTTRGKGTMVDVFLPVSATAVPAAVAPIEEDDEPAVGTVMVVDDERELREMMTITLERAGMLVAEHGCGVEALEAFRVDPTIWDVVITDQTMPSMRGSELVRRIKEISPETACVLCTGSAIGIDELTRASGADEILKKPMTPDELQETVTRLIAGRRRSATSGHQSQVPVRG